jgi:hypothetical protein
MTSAYIQIVPFTTITYRGVPLEMVIEKPKLIGKRC